MVVGLLIGFKIDFDNENIYWHNCWLQCVIRYSDETFPKKLLNNKTVVVSGPFEHLSTHCHITSYSLFSYCSKVQRTSNLF